MIVIAALLAAVQAPPRDVVGNGNASCGEWTAAQQENGWSRSVYDAWVGGFISGLNLVNPKGNLTTGMDFKGLQGWMDNYCAANPLDPISTAAVRLSVELRKRAQK
jgi:hypothetical protein